MISSPATFSHKFNNKYTATVHIIAHSKRDRLYSAEVESFESRVHILGRVSNAPIVACYISAYCLQVYFFGIQEYTILHINTNKN